MKLGARSHLAGNSNKAAISTAVTLEASLADPAAAAAGRYGRSRRRDGRARRRWL